jgi:hypothetical protein
VILKIQLDSYTANISNDKGPTTFAVVYLMNNVTKPCGVRFFVET